MATPIPLELTDDLSTQPVQVITGAQTIYAYNAENHNNYPVFIKFYDKLAVNVNPAVDAPAYTLTVPTATLIGPGRLINDSVALTFTTAITIRGTVNAANNDTTSPAASPALAIMLDQVTGGSGAVDSVNGHIGTVVLAASDVGAQPSDSDLTAIAALTTTAFGRGLLTSADAAGLRTTAGLGTAATSNTGDFDAAGAAAAAQAASQPVDSDLTAIAALTTTAFGRGLLASADAAALRTSAGLGTSAVKDIPAAGDATSAQVVFGTDTRLTNARTPSAHAASHASGGGDPVTLAESQVTNLTSDLGLKAPLASPTLTGTPAAPTAAVDTNTSQIASTAFVIAQASASGDGTPAMDGTAARGASLHYARANHVHPTDTSLAPLASPTFTGVPAAPTAAAATNTTQIASTAFVTAAVAAGAGAAGGDLGGTYPNPSVVSTGGTAFSPSATIDATNAANIDGVFPITQVGFTRVHVTETATITLALGDGNDKDSTASGTLTTLAFSGSPSETYPHAARIRLLVTNGPQIITIPTSRRLGSNVGTITTISLNNGNHELSWISQPSGVAGALEYWFSDSSDDVRQTFSNIAVVVGTGVRQIAQIGVMSALRVVTLPAASNYPNGSGFWVTDESGTVGVTNLLRLTRAGSDNINGGTTKDITTAYANVFVSSDGSANWVVNPDVSVTAGVSDVNFGNTWNGITTTAPSKNAVYDQLHLIDTTDTGKVTTLNCAAGIVNTNSGGTVQTAISTTGTGNVVLDTSATVTTPTIAAGGASRAPLRITSGTVATSPVAGDIEYDGKVHYATHAVNERGAIRANQFIRQTADFTLVSQTAAQAMFNTTANGAVTLAANTSYRFRCAFYITGMSTGSAGAYGFALGGTAVISSQGWYSGASKASGTQGTAVQMNGSFNAAANTAISASNSLGTGTAVIDGIVSITTGGTLIPQVSLGVAAAATIKTGAFFEIAPLGTDSVGSLGNWS